MNAEDTDKHFTATVMPDKGWWQALWPDPLGVLRKLGLTEGMTAIDVCCGDGHFTSPMSALLGGRVIGVDLDPEMLSRAKAAVEASGAPPCRWVEADAMDIAQHVPDKVDWVLMANTFHGVSDQTAFSKGVYAVLNPGGMFVIVNWHVRPREETPVLAEPRGPRYELRMSPGDVRGVVEAAGFVFFEWVELPPYHYGVILKKPD